MLSAREVVVRILEEREGASRVSDLVDEANPRDRALIRMLASGVLKERLLLDSVISCFSSRALSRISARVLGAIRVGAFELLFSRTPPYAAVDSAVECLRGKAERSFANGVLRAIARSAGHIEVPDIDAHPVRYVSLRYSHPTWIVEVFVRRFSLAGAISLCSIDNGPPGITLRVNALRSGPDAVLALLKAKCVAAAPGLLPGSVRLLAGAGVAGLPGFREGFFVVQDEGASLVSLVLDPQPGESVWDVCAAPGGKTTHMAEMMRNRGTVLATDIDAARVALVEEAASRLGLSIVRTATFDATGPAGQTGLGDAPAFDRILVDAPCSGLGVLGRNADLRWNRRPGDIPGMAARQNRLLRSACTRLKPGGTIVYSTCTLTEQENEQVWAGFLRDHPDYEPQDPAGRLPPYASRFLSGPPFAGPGYRYVLPQVSGTDGFFVARAVKRG